MRAIGASISSRIWHPQASPSMNCCGMCVPAALLERRVAKALAVYSRRSTEPAIHTPACTPCEICGCKFHTRRGAVYGRGKRLAADEECLVDME
jgi:hypothetical protein